MCEHVNNTEDSNSSLLSQLEW